MSDASGKFTSESSSGPILALTYELLCFDIPLIALGQPAKLDGMG